MRIVVCGTDARLSGWRRAALDLGLEGSFHEITGDLLRTVAEERGRADVLVLDLDQQPGLHDRATLRSLVEGVEAPIVIVVGTELSTTYFSPAYPETVGGLLIAESLGSSVIQRLGVRLYGQQGVELALPLPTTGPDTDSPWSNPDTPWGRRAESPRGFPVDPDDRDYAVYKARGLAGEVPLVLRPDRPGQLPESPVDVYREDLVGGVETLGFNGILALKGYAPESAEAFSLVDASSWSLLLELPPVAVCAAVLDAQREPLRRHSCR